MHSSLESKSAAEACENDVAPLANDLTAEASCPCVHSPDSVHQQFRLLHLGPYCGRSFVSALLLLCSSEALLAQHAETDEMQSTSSGIACFKNTSLSPCICFNDMHHTVGHADAECQSH